MEPWTLDTRAPLMMVFQISQTILMPPFPFQQVIIKAQRKHTSSKVIFTIIKQALGTVKCHIILVLSAERVIFDKEWYVSIFKYSFIVYWCLLTQYTSFIIVAYFMHESDPIIAQGSCRKGVRDFTTFYV